MDRLASSLLLLFAVGATWASADTPDFCRDEAAFMQENPVAFDVILAHVLYPVAVQSQGCDAEHRITPTDMKTILKALVESLGCPQGTGAHSAFSLQIEEAIGEDYFAEADLSEIPERYLSTDPNFCTSDELAQIKAANWEWVNADE